jgi:hypothetical protein
MAMISNNPIVKNNSIMITDKLKGLKSVPKKQEITTYDFFSFIETEIEPFAKTSFEEDGETDSLIDHSEQAPVPVA